MLKQTGDDFSGLSVQKRLFSSIALKDQLFGIEPKQME